MATTATTTTKTTTKTTATHFKVQSNQPIIKPKRRRYRETNISSSASATITTTTTAESTRKRDPPTIVSSNTNNWCCPATSKPISSTPPPPPPSPPPALPPQATSNPTRTLNPGFSPSNSPSAFKIRFSPGSLSPVMDFATTNGHHSPHNYMMSSSSSSSSSSFFPSSFSKFNSALTAGLLNPMSPPPPPPTDKARSSPTLFEMMANEPDVHPKTTPTHFITNTNNNVNGLTQNRNLNINNVSVQDRQALTMQRINDLLTCKSPGNQFNDSGSSDVRLTLSSKDGLSVSMSVHRQILVAHSRFFTVKLSDRWSRHKGGGTSTTSVPCVVEIADCDDVEVYIENLRLMYCKDLRRRLMREDVSKVLGILKVIF